MNNIVPIAPGSTMSSNEIAKLCDKQHTKVMDVIRDLLERGVAKSAILHDTFNPQNNQLYKEYLLDKRDSLIVVARMSPEFTAAIIDRWQELESGAHLIPKTMAEALRLAADQAELIENQALQIERDAPKVEFVDKYVDSEGLRGLQEAAKSLGFRPRSFTESLKADKFLYYAGNSLLPIQSHIQRGLFRVVEGEHKGHNFNQTKITAKGMAYFAKRYASELSQ